MTVILYDGECGFCSSAIRFVLKRDREGIFSFAAIQSEAGRDILRKHGIEEPRLDTMYLVDGDQIFERSSASLRIGKRLPRYRLLATIGLLVPRPLRDWVYNLVARNRHRLAGDEGCLLPSEEEEKRFLDRQN